MNDHMNPDGVLLDITTICPHGCIYCYHQKENLLKPENMDLTTFNSIIEILAAEGYRRIYLYMSGEPLINPHFYNFLNISAVKGFETNVATKAGVKIDFAKLAGSQFFFKESRGMLRWLIEVPAWNQESADHICSIDLDRQKFNLMQFGEMAKSGHYPNVSWRVVTIVTRFNECELNQIKKGLAKFGLRNWRFKRPGYFLDDSKNESWLPSPAFARRLDGRRSKCPFPKNVSINVSGDVSVCCHDMLFQIKMGNILKEGSLKKILRKNKKIMADRLSMKLKICKRCN